MRRRDALPSRTPSSYDAFGNKINSTGSTPNVYLYRGEQYHSDLGLYYLRARYYNPATGRFLSRDPERIGDKVKTPRIDSVLEVIRSTSPKKIPERSQKELILLLLSSPVIYFLGFQPKNRMSSPKTI
jgi:RHS repeat-associated protein